MMNALWLTMKEKMFIIALHCSHAFVLYHALILTGFALKIQSIRVEL